MWITPATLLQRGNAMRDILYPPDLAKYGHPDRFIPRIYNIVGERMAQGMNITEATYAGDSAMSRMVDADEDYAANLLRIRDCLLVPAGFPKTIKRVAACGLGLDIVPLDMGEARRMDGALTCLSLRF